MAVVWVYSLMGDPNEGEHGIPYVQDAVGELSYRSAMVRATVEATAHWNFERCFPGHCVCEERWDRQEIEENCE
ncbi:MAG TPA: hypothetical protein VJM50_18140 [Pyrinomonadaceae bacterium]|nr:hypothetical protein [Pyrinomonadaceae bacterium]